MRILSDFKQSSLSTKYGMTGKAVGKSLCFKYDDIPAALLAYRAAPSQRVIHLES